MKLYKFFFFLSLVFTLLLLFFIYQRTTPRNLKFENLPQAPSVKSNFSKNPVGISINSINVWLPLHPSKIENNHWETTNKGVSYWNSGVIPGQKGNAILYGHNWGNILGNLKNVKPGDNIEIFYEDNTKSEFKIAFKQVVEPSNISVLEESDDTRITLYTCIGFLDSQRLVVVAIN